MSDVVNTTLTSPPFCTSPKSYPTSSTSPTRWTRTVRRSTRPALDLSRPYDLATHAVPHAAPSSPKMAGNGLRARTPPRRTPTAPRTLSSAIKLPPERASTPRTAPPASLTHHSLNCTTRSTAARLCRCPAEGFVLRRWKVDHGHAAVLLSFLSLSALSLSQHLSQTNRSPRAPFSCPGPPLSARRRKIGPRPPRHRRRRPGPSQHLQLRHLAAPNLRHRSTSPPSIAAGR